MITAEEPAARLASLACSTPGRPAPRPAALRDTPNLLSSREKIHLHVVPICATIQSRVKGHGVRGDDGVEGTCEGGMPCGAS